MSVERDELQKSEARFQEIEQTLQQLMLEKQRLLLRIGDLRELVRKELQRKAG